MQEKFQEFPGGSSGSGRSSGEENGYPLQYSCLGKPLDRGAWKTTVYGIAKELDTTQGLNNNNYIMSRRRAEILFIYLPFCNFIYFVCIFGCAGSLLLHSGFLQLWWQAHRVASLVVEHRFQRTWASVVVAHGLSSCSSWTLEHRFGRCGTQVQLSCPIWDLSKPGNPCLLHWQTDSLPLSHQRSPWRFYLIHICSLAINTYFSHPPNTDLILSIWF